MGDFVPLILWRQDGAAAEFCDACQATWWGFETFAPPPEGDDPRGTAMSDDR